MFYTSMTGAGKISDIERNVNRCPGRRGARPDPAGGTLSVNAATKIQIHLKLPSPWSSWPTWAARRQTKHCWRWPANCTRNTRRN